ncbi:U11 U12 small nuclear ribonucleo 25 kDa [Brachionus plicatilis]|uniref:U11 U12 small nuclear ribonucleo 25 kDa n=1 Tax=Brachionus plicatilis TaxID=10195 RepID=A0A3M7RCT3_BRAPC|nr:U11 U12 small nuclear ribonucleo 25 kDa [Brachionus plicatilis]
MSFIEPNLGQVQQNKKILQELEEKKRRMRSNTTDSSATLSSSFQTIQQQNTSDFSLQQQIVQSKQPTSFTLFSSPQTFGYFINTDSNFGNQILPNETSLGDIDPNISLVELKNLLSLEYGESMNLFIRRADDQTFNVIVKLNSTLRDLKESIRNYFISKHEKDSSSITKAVNWKYIWKNYCLSFNNQMLLDNKIELRSYGISSKAELKFERIFHRKDKKKNLRTEKK